MEEDYEGYDGRYFYPDCCEACDTCPDYVDCCDGIIDFCPYM